MKLVTACCVLLITNCIGCTLVLTSLIVAGFLPNPFVDFGYGQIAPIILGLSLAIMALPCAWITVRVGALATLISVGLLQGLLSPFFGVLIMVVTGGIIGGRGVFIIPGIIGCILSFIVAFSVVQIIRKYRALRTT